MGFYKRVEQVRQAYARAARSRSSANRFRYDVRDACCSEEIVLARMGDNAYMLEYMSMSVFDRVFGTVGSPSPDRAAVDDAFLKSYPTLYEMLTFQGKVDGKNRKTCTMIVVCEDGQWKLGLKERDRDVSLWISGETFIGSLMALEDALNAPVVAWRRPVETTLRVGRSQNRQP